MIQRLQEFGARLSSEVPVAKEESAGKAQMDEIFKEIEEAGDAERDHGGAQQKPSGEEEGHQASDRDHGGEPQKPLEIAEGHRVSDRDHGGEHEVSSSSQRGSGGDKNRQVDKVMNHKWIHGKSWHNGQNETKESRRW